MIIDKKKIIDMMGKGLRLDGRKADEFRKIKVEYGITKSAEGSSRVTLGDTVVLAGVKMEVAKPYPDTPDQGGLMVGAELLPMSSPEFESGPPSDWAVEVARVVDRGVRESHAIDVKNLVVKKGELVWNVIVDIVTINDAGNILDASAVAVLAALKDTKLPKLEKDIIDYKAGLTKEKLPVKELPIAVTVYKIGKELFVDPTNDEEKQIDARLTVTSIEDGSLCSLQKGGEAPLSVEEIDKMIDIAIKHAKSLRKDM
ncbi:TPA: exosome complex protein Rrp42 [Candidatus Woesearchaeota archaeon]|nr:exosome complex protein Rrp42 [Candidatus Woesearchaeota archaeon]